MSFRTILLIIISCLFTSLFSQEKVWQDINKDVDTRVDALIGEMSVDEKISQMIDHSVAIPRLELDAYEWWSEALHGVARSAKATIFPQTIGMAATFDVAMIEDVGVAISDEARAIYNQMSLLERAPAKYLGLTFWSPNVNIFRDPRWGRGQETFGEDPFLSGQLGAHFIRGMQGYDPNYLKTASCAKHFAVHSGPEALRHSFNAIANEQDLWETYLPAFKSCVDANVEAVMCAYNRTNDEACCGSNFLLKDVLIDQWHFKGHIVSDCGAIENFHNDHKLTTDVAHSAALALKNGVNLNCGLSYTKGLRSALEQGLITEAELDNSLKKLLHTRFKLGMFDPVELNPYSSIGVDVINNSDKRQLTLEAAQKSIVLLKNNGALPLDKESDFIYMTGPLASEILSLVGNYNGTSPHMTTVLEGVTEKISSSTRIQYRPGTMVTGANSNEMDWFSKQAEQAEATIVVLGLTQLLEGEEGEAIASPSKGDILDMKLPDNQMNLLRKISEKAHLGNKKVVTVICAGVPLDLREIEKLSDAIVYAWYPGERGGEAVADILFGDVSPSGKLPITFPQSVEQLPAFEDYSMDNRTYKYMTEKPMYPFGFGLSYGDIRWSTPSIGASELGNKDTTTLSVNLTNNSSMELAEVVQVYVSFTEKNEDLPIASLKAFQRISLKQGESKELSFIITPEMFDYIDNNGKRMRHKGKAVFTISNASPGERAKELGATQFEIVVNAS